MKVSPIRQVLGCLIMLFFSVPGFSKTLETALFPNHFVENDMRVHAKSPSYDFSGWNRKQAITIGSVMVDGSTNLINFPVPVTLDYPNIWVKVRLSEDWADYVFAESYDLPTSEEVERHIRERGHLINIPLADEVEANAIEIGHMNRLFLGKVEELTLYFLQQEQDQKRLPKELKALQKEVSNIRTDHKR